MQDNRKEFSHLASGLNDYQRIRPVIDLLHGFRARGLTVYS